MAPKVLFVLSSHNQLGTSGKPTGWYLPEFAHPYYALKNKGAEITVASPEGGEAPLDPSSVEAFKEDAESQKFLNEESALWKSTGKLEDFLGKASQFDALFFVGGHGPMFDLATSTTSHALIREFHNHDKILSAVCHGPAAFANVQLADGSYLVANQTVTGFSNAEEESVQLAQYMPFPLESQLTKNGATFVKADQPWGPKVVVSGKIYTGQNPASAAPLGEKLWEALSA